MKLEKAKHIIRRQEQFSARQISRRQFILSLTAVGLTVPAALSLASKAEAGTPKFGGHMRFGSGHGSTTDSFDPATWQNDFNGTMAGSYTNALVEVDVSGKAVPEVAESFETTDGKTWVFNLRSGAEFHNGKTITPEDVIASLNYHRGENSKSTAKDNLAAVIDIRADGNSVIFELNEANAGFPYITSYWHFAILPSIDGEIDPNSGIGSGGYVVEEFDPGVRFSAKRFPNYFKENAAYFDSFEMLVLSDMTARQNALLSDQVDIIDRIDPKTVSLLERVPHIDILEVTGSLHYSMPMRMDMAPFDNYDLRMAIKFAVKRQELVDKILSGHGTLGNDQPISSAYQFYAADIPQREFDADKARYHYEKSGHSGPIQFSASEAAFAGAVDAAQLIAASASEAGIDVQVVREPSDGYWSDVWNKKSWTQGYWNGRPTEDWMFSSAFTKESEWNESAWRGTKASERFNKIVVEARAELDQAKRRKLYAEAQLLIHDDAGALIPMFANYITANNKRIQHHEKVGANSPLDGQKHVERWWMV